MNSNTYFWHIASLLTNTLYGLILAVGGVYLIDKNRMDNNKPVVFSTWGYQYVPPVNHEDITEEIPNISGENLPVSIPLRENEDLLINLLDGWKYEALNEEPERYEYVIAFYSPRGEKKNNPIIQASAKNDVIIAEDIILDGYSDYELTEICIYARQEHH